ncbi:hypothetical protein Pan241w_14900 [Gimesia alba]|uniref:Dockerin domain-containing protein n=1 Tax=Gimesia alba TaxID=2527973 RepID=A0A517RC11_9PLAN|nr:hypothetical protein [Gimesia alba]QDT41429.1 hypothetical protein Pan241w_14900 [Gimesia alba]
MRLKQNLMDQFLCFSREIQVKFHQLWRCHTLPTVKQRPRPVYHQIEYLEDRTLLTAAFPEFIDPNPSADNGFGDTVVVLSTGNVVITSPYDDAGGTDAGAVYLFDGATRGLISILRGSTSGDKVGSDGVTVLSNGNYVVSSPYWDNGSIVNAGAVTFGDGNTGVSGIISAANSLVGTKNLDQVGRGGVTALSNGNYVVNSTYWDNGTISNAGAVTFGNGITGVSGVVSAANSLVGTTGFESVFAHHDVTVTALSNGNYVVSDPAWDNDMVKDVGAVTFGNGTTGITGVVTEENSLIGTTENDYVGGWGIEALPNGNYVVVSTGWDNGSIANVGAVTLGNGTIGTTGIVSAENSLIGSHRDDFVGRGGMTVLTNGNFVVTTPWWDNGTHTDAGAVTFVDGTTGVTGIVSAENSLVGAIRNLRVGGYNNVTALTNGNYVVSTPWWDEGQGSSHAVGAVTFGNGTTGVTGDVSAENSLIGLGGFDEVGSGGIFALSNGNYLVLSQSWDNETANDAGAVTFGNGTTGITGVVSAENSLVGTSTDDNVGSEGVVELSNGNYVVRSLYWSNDGTINAGAVTFGDGNTGVSGVVSAENSLVGSSADDYVGGVYSVTALSNGNYVVSTPSWSNGTSTNVGAVTFGNGTSGVTGVVSVENSLIGTTENDFVGSGGVTALSNGNYVVSSRRWNNGLISNAGAVTFGDGNTGSTGIVSAANSLVGSFTEDQLGGYITALSNGNYIVGNNLSNVMATQAGAVTFGDGTTGVTGVISTANSLVGSTDYDAVGGYGVSALSNSNYLVTSISFDTNTKTYTGVVTFGDGTTGIIGEISSTNSVIGTESSLKPPEIILDEINNTFIVVLKDEGRVWVGSQADGFQPRILEEISDVIISENSTEQTVNLTGITAGSRSGNQLRVTATSGNTDLIPDPVVSYTSLDSTGSLTFIPSANQTGTATITVTIEDGGLDRELATTEDNFWSQRTFDVLVSIPVDIDLRVVSSPTAVRADGHASTLPTHRNRADEWSSFWLEIWVSTTNIQSPGIFSTSLELSYQTEYISPTTIEYGSSFSHNQTGTINDPAGVIENLSAVTNQTDLGISDYLLFTRIKFESLADDGVNLDIQNQLIGPYDLGFSVSSPQVSDVTGNPVSTTVNSFPGTSIWANPYDLNDDDSINIRDLILFITVYGTIPDESDSDYAWVADLDQNNQVNIRDLILLISNYGKQKVDAPEINYPDNFPESWNNQLITKSQKQLQVSTKRLTQSAAETILENAIANVTPHLTSGEKSKLDKTKVQVVNLNADTLGQAVAGTIYLDQNAAGYGWFVDTTPFDNSEFKNESELTLIALPDSDAFGYIDLWTVINHEIYHLLGYNHEADGLMKNLLLPGIRKNMNWEDETDQYFTTLLDEIALTPFE